MKFKAGDRVQHIKTGTEGTIIKVFKKGVRVKFDTPLKAFLRGKEVYTDTGYIKEENIMWIKSDWSSLWDNN